MSLFYAQTRVGDHYTLLISTFKMEAEYYSETFVYTYRTTKPYSLHDLKLFGNSLFYFICTMALIHSVQMSAIVF